MGHGDQDFGPILEASVEAGAQWVVVEQDQSNGRPPMEAITLSRQYLKEQVGEQLPLATAQRSPLIRKGFVFASRNPGFSP